MSGNLIELQDSRENAVSETPLVWEPRVTEWPTLPPEASVVRLIFHGLMGFSCETYGFERYRCDVGFHRGNSSHPHRLRIAAFERGCSRIDLPDLPPSEIRIEVTDPLMDGIGFFQPTDVATRHELEDHDFRWIIDFESDYLYRKHLPVINGHQRLRKRPNIYRPKLTLNNGLFYTLHKTSSTFRAQSRDGDPRYVTDLGNVADYTAANIYVNAGDAVRLIIDGQTYTVDAPGEIQFFNDCNDPDSGEPCEFNPYDLEDKERRNDFYVNYAAFHLDGLREYELFLLERGRPTEPEMCESRLTDEAPCAGAGFGGAGGLP